VSVWEEGEWKVGECEGECEEGEEEDGVVHVLSSPSQ